MTGNIIKYDTGVLSSLVGEVHNLVASAKGAIEDLRQGDTALSNSWVGQSSAARHALSVKTKESLDENATSLHGFGRVVEEVFTNILNTDSTLASNYGA